MEKAEKTEITVLRLKDGNVGFASDDLNLIHDIEARIDGKIDYETWRFTLDDVRDAVEFVATATLESQKPRVPPTAGPKLHSPHPTKEFPEHALVPESFIREAEKLLVGATKGLLPERERKLREVLGSIVSTIQRSDLINRNE